MVAIMQQPTLFRTEIMLSMVISGGRTRLGGLGEFAAMHIFQRLGWLVKSHQPGEHCGDLRVINQHTGEFVDVEVKTARKGKNGYWKFNLYKAGKTDCRHADMVVLLAVLQSGRCVTFFVPVADLEGQTCITISSHPECYAGKWSKYRTRPENVRLF